MKNKKFSKRLAVVLSAVMVFGGISLHSVAEEFISDIEVSVEESFDGDFQEIEPVEEFFVEEPVFEEDFVAIEEDSIIEEIVIEDIEFGSEEVTPEVVETEVVESEEQESETIAIELEDTEEVDTAEAEEVMEEAAKAAGITTISLNYDAYTLTEIGQIVTLVATVNAPAEEEAAEEAAAEETAVAEEAADELVVFEDEVVLVDENAEKVMSAEEIDLVGSVEEMTDSVSWTSSNPEVATVDEVGIVTAVASGEAVITCTLDSDANVTATCVITVTAECALQEHVHSREVCFARELICDHTFDDEHTPECFLNKFVCGLEEHVHVEECFDQADDANAELTDDNTVVQ